MTQSRAANRIRRPTREQSVAALLVGAVVVLLGFASGLGLTSAAPTAADAGRVSLGPSGAALKPPATPTSAAPIAYVVPPAAPVAAPQPVAVPPAAGPSPSIASTAPSPTPTTHVPTAYSIAPSGPAPAPTPTPPACPPDAVPGILTALLALPPADLPSLVAQPVTPPVAPPGASTPSTGVPGCIADVTDLLPSLSSGTGLGAAILAGPR